MTLRLLSACLGLGAMTPVAHASGAALVRNVHVLVTERTVAPGAALDFPAEYPCVIVFLDPGKMSSPNGAATEVHRGDTEFRPAGAAATTNLGTAPCRIVRTELLGNGAAERWGTTGLAPHYKLLFENPYVRVYDIRIPAETSEPQHTHHDRVVVCLSGATLRHEMPDGRVENSTLKTDEIAWRRGGTHVGHNLGKTDLWVIAIEPK